MELWFKNALVYTVEIETFADGNGDGIGDFDGLTSKLDYLAGLNVNTLWVQPFFPTPNRDNGYDITDYYNVDPRFGSLGDFVAFSRAAADRGIRILVDLVVNHTSIDHPWFQDARRNPKSRYREYYVWSKDLPPHADEGMVFPGAEKSTWAWDDVAKLYYFHRFYWHQPDLNTGNPAVRREIEKIIGYWTQLGVAGFRVDALPFVISSKGPGKTGYGDCPHYLIDMRECLSWNRGDAIFMAEANIAPDQAPIYFGEGDRIHVIINFFLNQHFFLAMARQDATPIRKAFDALPTPPPYCQWANFLRSHDELDLGRLSDSERQEVFRAFGPDPNMQLYNRGIRRRLAPMLGNDRRRLELAHSLLLTLPGAPVMRYGDEIGMGEDLSLNERDSIRTPMQWADARNGGFSSTEGELILPVISGGEFGYERVNVAAQQRDPESLLNWIERAARLRRRCPEFGYGGCEWLETSDRAVLAHCCSGHCTAVFAIHNLSDREFEVTVNLGRKVSGLYDMLANRPQDAAPDGRQKLKMTPYGYYWFRAGRDPESMSGCDQGT